MHHIESDDGNNNDNATADDDETVVFFAEVHAEYTRKTFDYSKGIVYDKWIICNTADNARVNVKTGELLKIPYVR